MCGFFFEIGIDCGNMVCTMFDEALKGEAAILVERYEAIGIAHEAVCHLAAVDDQEHGKVIEEFFMRISTKRITVEDDLHAVEKKANVWKEGLTKESHMKDVLNIIFEYTGVQNNMGVGVESKVVNKFDADYRKKKKQYLMMKVKIMIWMFLKTKMNAFKTFFNNGVKNVKDSIIKGYGRKKVRNMKHKK